MSRMSQQTMRQKARRDARSVTSKRRAALLERARRLEDLAVQVMTAVGERDAAVAKAEKRAGAALREMTTVEGVTLRAAVEWCGDQIGVREATRLRRLAENGHEDGAKALAATAAAAESVEEVAVRRLADRPHAMQPSSLRTAERSPSREWSAPPEASAAIPASSTSRSCPSHSSHSSSGTPRAASPPPTERPGR
jgi:hypothetical protein